MQRHSSSTTLRKTQSRLTVTASGLLFSSPFFPRNAERVSASCYEACPAHQLSLPEPTSTSDEPSHGAPFQVTAAHWLHWQPRSEAASCFHYIKKKKQKQTNNYKKEIPLITNRRRQWGAEVEQQSPAALRTSAPWRRPLGGWERASLAPWRLPAERRKGSLVWGRQVGPGVVSDQFLKSSANRGLRASRGNLASCLPNLIEKRFSLSPAWTFLFQFVSDTVILLPCTTVRCLSPPSQ